MPWETPTGTIDGSSPPTLHTLGPICDELVAVDRFVQYPLIDYTPPGSNALAFLWVLPATARVRVKSKTAHDPNWVPWETPESDGAPMPLLTFSRPVHEEWLAVDRLLQAPGVHYVQVSRYQLQLLWAPPSNAIIRGAYSKVPSPRRIGWEQPRRIVTGAPAASLLAAAPITGEEIFAADGMVQIPGIDYALAGGTDLGAAAVLPANAVLALLYDTAADPGSDTSGALVHARDIEGAATGHLLQQYRDATAPGVREAVQTVASEVQTAEDALWSSLDDTGLDSPTTVGAQLDRIGKVVGQDREGLQDADYLVWLKARVKLNKSTGSINQILAIFSIINPTAALKFVEQFPAAFALQVHGIVVEAAAIQAAILNLARKAGVRSVLEYSTAPTGDGFTFAGGDGKGFPDASLTPGSGGKLAGALA